MLLAQRTDALTRALLLALFALLPAVASCKSLTRAEPDVQVVVHADGTVRVDGQRVAIPDLPIVLRTMKITPQSDVELLVHPDAPLRYLAEVNSAFGAVGFSPGQVKSKPFGTKAPKKKVAKAKS